MKHFLTAALGVALLAPASFAQQLVFDSFNRPDSSDLGFDWAEQNGDFVIQNNFGKGNVPFANDTWMNHTAFGQPYESSKVRMEFARDSADFFFGAGLVLGLDPNTWSGVAVLVQDNDLDGLFDRIFFHAAINAGAWFSSPTPILYDFPTPIDAGQLTVWVQDSGDLAVARVEDTAGNLIGTYSAQGIVGTPFAPTGVRAGVWVRSRPFINDFYALERRALDAYPKSISVASGGEQTLDITLESARANDVYFLLASLTAADPGTPIGGGINLPLVIDPLLLWTLTSPNTAPYANTFGTLDAVGHARARVTLAPAAVPALVGIDIHQAAIALDPVTFTPTAATNSAVLSLEI